VKRTGCFFIVLLAAVFVFGIIHCKVALASNNEACFFCHDKELSETSPEERANMVEKSTPPKSEIVVKEYLKYNKPYADLSLFLNQEKYAGSVHRDLECISCHEDIKVIPHGQHLKKPVSCSNCHGEEIAQAVEKSVHGKLNKGKFPGCVGCHDPHYGRKKENWEAEFDVKGCLPCHKFCTPKLMSKSFSHSTLHTQIKCNTSKVGCVICHASGESKDPHKIEPAKSALTNCVACHSSGSILLAKKPVSDKSLIEKATNTDFTNEELMREGQYVIGANRIPALDSVALLIIIGTFGLPIVHGGLRFITRKKKKD